MRTGAGYFDSGAESGEPQVEPGNHVVGPEEEHEAESGDVPVVGVGGPVVDYDEAPVAELGTVLGVGREGYPGTWLGGAHEVGQTEVDLFVKGVGRRGEGH